MNTVGFVIAQNLQAIVTRRVRKQLIQIPCAQEDHARTFDLADSATSATADEKDDIEIMEAASNSFGATSAPQQDGAGKPKHDRPDSGGAQNHNVDGLPKVPLTEDSVSPHPDGSEGHDKSEHEWSAQEAQAKHQSTKPLTSENSIPSTTSFDTNLPIQHEDAKETHDDMSPTLPPDPLSDSHEENPTTEDAAGENVWHITAEGRYILLTPDGRYVNKEDAIARGIGGEGDYTEGPARVIVTTDDDGDGLRRCGALLLKYDLSLRIKKTIQFQRRFLRDQAYARAQLKEIREFENYLGLEILGKARMLRDAKSEEKKTPLQCDLDILRKVKDLWQMKKTCFATMENYGIGDLQNEYLGIMKYLEDAFIVALMIGADENTETRAIEKPTVEKEFSKMSDVMYEEVPQPPDFTPTPEQLEEDERQNAIMEAKQAKQWEILSTWRLAKKAHHDAQVELEKNEKIRKKMWEKYIESDERNIVSREGFWLLWKPVMQEVQQVLDDAEENLTKAKDAAAEAEVRTDDDPSSYYQ